jgi:hypothetical protein
MTGYWPEGLIKNQMGISPFKTIELMASYGIIPGPLQCAVPHLNLPSAIYIVCLALGHTLKTWMQVK